MGPPPDNTGAAGSEQANTTEGSAQNPTAGGSSGEPDLRDTEPVFGEGSADAESLPDLRDTPTRSGTEDVAGTTGMPSTDSGASNRGAGAPPGGSQPGQATGSAGGMQSDSGSHGTTVGVIPGSSSGGPLTPAEQVAILDAQLERGAGEFDAIILQTEAEQREAAREAAQNSSAAGGGITGSGGASAEEGDSPYGEGMADAGGYSTGGGMGGTSGGGGAPQNTAKYPPPGDIPSGNDDDVVARQLREAASREPDPAVREKLWDEYRKYKGIDQ